MSNIIYRNRDTKAIRKLLIVIGKHKYEQALMDMKIKHRPLTMEGFYLESNNYCIFLNYRYPIGHVQSIMKVEQFDAIPKNGWELIKQKL